MNDDEPLVPRINYLLAKEDASRLVIVDDVEGPPLTELQREQMLEWFEQVKTSPDLIFKTTFYGGNSITTVRPRDPK